MAALKTNVLYYGDNLEILREHIPDESIDLIYLDPPFNSQADYNVLFRESSGAGSGAQIEAFEDTWHWGAVAQAAYEELVMGPHQPVARMLRAMVDGLGHNDVTAYLTMMAVRLVELHRVLKPTGSIYLHCDPTASHYLKIVMDAIFGKRNLVNEIVWKRSDAHSDVGQGARHLGRLHDVILFYAKSTSRTFNALFSPLPESTVKNWYRHIESETGRRYNKADLSGPRGAAKGNPYYEWNGHLRYWRVSRERMQQFHDAGRLVYSKSGIAYLKRYLDESKGVTLQDWWDDIPMVRGIHKGERLGYQTQKPLAVLKRIIQLSSDPDDIVLDPFCGCGTAVHAAHKLGRRWIGIDITHLAISLIRRRMQDAFPGLTIEVIGEPKDLEGAKYLASSKPKQFEYWVVDKLDAQPTGGKGQDLDGIKPFIEFGGKVKRAVISVKGTKSVNPEMIREVLGALDPDKPIGILATLAKPTGGMITQALAAGFYESAGQKYYRVQIIPVKDILTGKRPHLPSPVSPFTKAPKEKKKGKQETLL